IIRKDQIDDVVAKLKGTAIYEKALLGLCCGLRAGEVLALRWRSVDLEGKILVVRESVEEVAGQPPVTKTPKTEAGDRKLTLPDIVIDGLRDHRRKQFELRLALGLGKLPDDALVFPALDGGLCRRPGLSIEWRETVEALGLPDITFHGLRH